MLAGQCVAEGEAVVSAGTDAVIADLEFVQVRIFPAHGALDHVMERFESQRVLHFDAAPYRRIDAFQRDVQQQPALRIVLGKISEWVVEAICQQGMQALDQMPVVLFRIPSQFGRPVFDPGACVGVPAFSQQQHFEVRQGAVVRGETLGLVERPPGALAVTAVGAEGCLALQRSAAQLAVR